MTFNIHTTICSKVIDFLINQYLHTVMSNLLVE